MEAQNRLKVVGVVAWMEFLQEPHALLGKGERDRLPPVRRRQRRQDRAAAFALSACGDDTVNPSNPDAGPSKDGTAESSAKDGGDGGRADAPPDGVEDARGGDVHQNDGKSEDASGD